MEFRNGTPFAVLHFMMLDKNDAENHVVVMKIGYSLEPTGNGEYRVRVRDDDAVALCTEDEFSGELNTSSVIRENDLAPFKRIAMLFFQVPPACLKLFLAQRSIQR